MSFYGKASTTALRLLNKYGQPITINTVVTGAYNPETGTQSTTITTANAVGALFNHKAKDIDNTLIMSGDKRLIMDAGVSVKTDDTITANGITYTVVAISELKPSVTRVLWICNLRASV